MGVRKVASTACASGLKLAWLVINVTNLSELILIAKMSDDSPADVFSLISHPASMN
jgi:hypothetical protein